MSTLMMDGYWLFYEMTVQKWIACSCDRYVTGLVEIKVKRTVHFPRLEASVLFHISCFISQAIGGILATLYGKDQLQRELRNDFNNTILKFYNFNVEKTEAIDRLQR